MGSRSSGSRNKGSLPPTGLRSLVKNGAEKAGVRGFSSRRLRATYADRWLQVGGNPGDLMRVLELRTRKMIGRTILGGAAAALVCGFELR